MFGSVEAGRERCVAASLGGGWVGLESPKSPLLPAKALVLRSGVGPPLGCPSVCIQMVSAQSCLPRDPPTFLALQERGLKQGPCPKLLPPGVSCGAAGLGRLLAPRALLRAGLWVPASRYPTDRLSCWVAEEAGAVWEPLARGCPQDPERLSAPQGRYDEEIEVYRHHLEQMYKLCRPCQAAVEHYIKHQNRQLRALLLSHQFKRREADQTHSQSFCSSAVKAPVQVIALRALAFLACAFLLTTALYGTSSPFAPGAPLPPALPPGSNGSATSNNGTAPGAEGWRQLLGLLPEHTAEKLREAWAFGQGHQLGVVALGLLTCLLAMLLAGRIRLRRIDAFSTGLWALLLGLHLAEQHLQAASPSWLDTLKFSTTSLCCLVGFTAAVATRKATGPRRFRPRRCFPGDSAGLFPTGPSLAIPYPSIAGSSPSLFVPTPPGFLPLANQQLFRSPRRASPSSLPGRLSRALSLGTIPSLTRADSGYLFSGSRPPSQVSRSGEVPVSGYFSLLSGSCPSSPVPSPAPSVAGSVASSSGSLRHRRPLISPARLNLEGRKLLLFPSPSGEAPSMPSSPDEHSHPNGSLCTVEPPQVPQKQPARDTKHTLDMKSVPERDSTCSSGSIKKEDDSSQSSSCVVDTTTRGCAEEATAWRGRFGPSVVRGLLAVSLAANALFTSAYLYQSLR
uniref:Transmembrane protein 201 C-terminal domain-containing protein n=1 Tax=Sus scrofa TaxID=9823 RepID=A0A8D1VS33_PIG